MFQAKGYYCPGVGCAGRYLQVQVPLIAAGGFEEINNFHRGTINVQFEPMIVVSGADHRTAPIPWCGPQNGGEIFEFVRARLSCGNPTVQVAALMYIAHWSGLRMNPHMHEFMVERFIPGLQFGAEVIVECDRQSVVLPYASRGTANGMPLTAETIVIL